MEFAAHITSTMKQLNFRPKGKGLNHRTSIAFLYIQGDVGILSGVQGMGFFEAGRQHLDEALEGLQVLMGYIPGDHIEKYRSMGLDVTERWRTSPYPDGPEMVWIEARRMVSMVAETPGLPDSEECANCVGM